MSPVQTCSKCGTSFLGNRCPGCAQESADETTALPLPTGGRFRGFEVVHLLGRGGMGVVYKARQPSLNRFVALKILPPEKAYLPTFESRFEREAQALAALSHPNILGVYDFGKEESFFFIAMEYVDGKSLREILDERRLSRKEALDFLTQVCDGLEFAHRAGVVHRDIKPANILIDTFHRAKICDFGLAKMIDPSTPAMTQTGMALGTAHYMAPEQLENARAADHRADIYSVGALAYEMLTGRPPVGALDANIDRAIVRALAKRPEDRHTSVAEFKTDLLGTAPVESQRSWYWIPALVAVPLLAVGIWWRWIRKPTLPPTPQATTQPQRELVENHNEGGSCVVFSPDTTLVAAASHKEIQLFRSVDGQLARTLRGHTSWVTALAISPDGTTLASGCHDGTIKLWSVESGREVRTLAGHVHDVLALAYHAEGRTLSSGDAEGIIKLWRDGNEVGELRGHQGMIFALAFHGLILASGSGDETIRLWEWDARREIGVLAGHNGAVRSLDFRPDGKVLASGSADHTIRLWDVDKRDAIRELTGPSDEICSVAFDRDGKRLASGSRDRTVRIWDSTERKRYTAQIGWIVAVAFRADGALLYSEGYAGRITVEK